MKIEKQSTMNKNGTYTTKRKITTAKEDGWVNTRKTLGIRASTEEGFFKGKSVTYHYQTNDPRVTQPALLLISLLMFMAAIFMIAFAALFHAMTVMFFGIIFLIFLIIFFVSNIRAIRRVEKEIQDRKGQ